MHGIQEDDTHFKLWDTSSVLSYLYLICVSGGIWVISSGGKYKILSSKSWMLWHFLALFQWEGNGTPLQYSCLENPVDGGAGRLQSIRSLRVGHDWTTSLSLFTFMRWSRKWQPTPVFLPGESQDGGAWWAAVCGVTQSQTRLKWISSSSSSIPEMPWLLPVAKNKSPLTTIKEKIRKWHEAKAKSLNSAGVTEPKPFNCFWIEIILEFGIEY